MTGAARLPPGFRLVALDEVDSTNAEARRRAEAGAPEGTLILARSQSAGRGRRGRAWRSPPGNLYMSLLLRPERPLAEAARLGFVAAVALSDALAALSPPLLELTLKWPNDVTVAGRKIAGMLIESAGTARGALDWLVIGIGVNLASHPADTPYPATDLAAEGAPGIAPEDLAAAFARHFLRWTDIWLEQGFAPVRLAWLARAQGLGEPIVVRLEGECVSGLFEDLDDDGLLGLRLADGGLRRVSVGDVFPGGA